MQFSIFFSDLLRKQHLKRETFLFIVRRDHVLEDSLKRMKKPTFGVDLELMVRNNDRYNIINPLRMRSRVTVVVLCVCLSVCLSVTTLVARELISTVQACCQPNQHDTSKVFNTWISLKRFVQKLWRYLPCDRRGHI